MPSKLCKPGNLCDDCIEAQEGGLFGSALKPAPAPPIGPRTQKARGLMRLRQIFGTPLVPLAKIVQQENEIPTVWERIGVRSSCYPAFARPCPVRPRHGFVESRIVRSPEEARAVWAEAIKEDPEAEMLMMEPIAATHSAVVTPQGATLGPGNDGATSGKDCVTIPLASIAIPPSLLKAAGITDTPYLEVVYQGSATPRLVQLRDGPNPTKGIKITVANVITLPEDPAMRLDLLAWERTIKEAPENTAVYHPGGSLTSHYAAHAIMRGFPVMLDRCPTVGETVETKPQADYDVEAFRRGVGAGWSAEICARAGMGEHDIDIVLFAAHHATALRTTVGAFLLGYGAVLLIRYGMAASIGEARHARHRAPSRDQMYLDSFRDPLVSLSKASRIFHLFHTHDWAGGFGGKPWADCVQAMVDLDVAIRKAYRRGSQESIAALVGVLHTAVNQAHNNGWFLNKFTSPRLFDRHAQGHLPTILVSLGRIYTDRKWEADTINQDLIAAWAKKRKPRLRMGPLKRNILAFKIQTAFVPGGSGRNIAGSYVHVQVGCSGNYKSFNLPFPENCGNENTGSFVAWREWFDALKPCKSLSGSADSGYKGCKIADIPEWVKRILVAQGFPTDIPAKGGIA